MQPRGRKRKHTPTPEERVITALLTLLDSMQIGCVGDGYDIGYNQALWDIRKRLTGTNQHDNNQRMDTDTSGATDDDGEWRD